MGAALGLLALVLVRLGNEEEGTIKQGGVAGMVGVSLGLMAVFSGWMHMAEKKEWPVLISNTFPVEENGIGGGLWNGIVVECGDADDGVVLYAVFPERTGADGDAVVG